MWIFTKDGFFSVVQDRDDETVVLVRARRRADLENILKPEELPGIQDTPGADYGFRIFMDRKRWTSYAAAAASRIDYSNFKGAIEDDELHDFMMAVWTVARDYQRGQFAPNGDPRTPSFGVAYDGGD